MSKRRAVHGTRWRPEFLAQLNLCNNGRLGHNARVCYACGQYHRKVTCKACLKEMKKRKARK